MGQVREIVHVDEDSYLRAVGERVRDLRVRRALTRRTLSAESGVSERYLAQLEAGQGNASILILRQLAHALGVTPEALIAERETSAADARLRRGARRGWGCGSAGPTAGSRRLPASRSPRSSTCTGRTATAATSGSRWSNCW